MKKFSVIALSLFIVACQSPRQQNLRQFPQNANARSVQSFNNTTASQKLPLSDALESELRGPDGDQPLSQDLNEETFQKIFQTGPDTPLDAQYIHAHNQYFTVLDKGSSSIERILVHDGHNNAAALITKYRDLLGESALWPDHHSTTYKGPFKALEHGFPSENKGWFGLRNARQKAQEYYEKALSTWRRDLPPDHPAQKESWEWLGRTSHFIQDLTVPFHTRPLTRLPQVLFHNKYERVAQEKFEDYLPTRNHNPFQAWENGPYPATGTWGNYFPANTSASQMIIALAEQSAPFYKQVVLPENKKTGNWEKTRTVMIPLGAKSTAGLVVNFLNTVGVKP